MLVHLRRSAMTVCLTALITAAPLRAAMAEEANTIVIKDFDYSPMMLTIKPGTTVTWKNLDGEPHTIVGLDGAFRSGALDQGDSFSHTFDKPGTYQYICSIHPKMRAQIVVQ